MVWQVATAKQRLSELIRKADEEPQVIVNRERPVAAIIGVSDLAAFLEWKRSRAKRTLGAAFEDAQKIASEERFELVVPDRVDRSNPLLGKAPRAPRRHQRPQ